MALADTLSVTRKSMMKSIGCYGHSISAGQGACNLPILAEYRTYVMEIPKLDSGRGSSPSASF
jgi:hypothetical protein